jgi:imidazolonepropionase-like amidohydrolase
MKTFESACKILIVFPLSWILISSATVLQAQIVTQDVTQDEFGDGERYLNQARDSSPPIAFDGATLIDGTGGPPLENARILIDGDRIVAIGRRNEVQIPNNAQVINVQGKVIMPGLIDSHAHYRLFTPELMITHGITTQIDTGNYMNYSTTIRDLIAEGKLWGNRVFTTGSGITSHRGEDKPKRDRFRVSTPGEARKAAEIHVQNGVDFIKVYSELTVDHLRAITEVAHAAGLKVVGHIGAMDAREAALAGIDGLIHGLGISAALVSKTESEEMKRVLGGLLEKGEKANPWGTPGGGAFHWNMDESRYDDLIKLLVDHNVMIQPDIVHSTKGVLPQWDDRFALEDYRLFADNPGLHYIADNVKRNWLTTDYLDGETAEDMDRRRVGLKKFMDFLIRFYRSGGLLLAGSDTQGSAVAGITLHQELEVFVDMGLTPMEALLTATRNPAEFYLPGKGLGVLKAGNFADLIVLNANPLEDIRNTREIEMVMLGGKFMEMGYHMPYEDPLRELFIKTAPSPYRHLIK